jgi:hypothetical protein
MTSTLASTQTELTAKNFNQFLKVTLVDNIQFQFEGHGNAAVNGSRVPPPHHPGNRPHIDDTHINHNSGLPTNRRMYAFQTPSEEELEEAKRTRTKIDPYDYGLTIESTRDLYNAQRNWDSLAKECRTLTTAYNKSDMQCTARIISLLGTRTLAQIKLNSLYVSLTCAPADLVATCTTSTLLTILADTFSAGNASDASSAFTSLLAYDYISALGLASNLTQIDQLIRNALDRLTNSDGLIDPNSLHSLMIIQKISRIEPRLPWHTRFLHKALNDPPESNQPLPSPHRLQILASLEEQLSATVDNNNIDDLESEQGAGYKSTVRRPTKQPSPTLPRDPTTSDRRERTHPIPCWCCEKFDGKLRFGHLAEVCTNNPKNKKPNSTDTTNSRHKYNKAGATGHLAATAEAALAAAAATATANANANAAAAASKEDDAYELAFLRGHYSSKQDPVSTASSVSGLP